MKTIIMSKVDGKTVQRTLTNSGLALSVIRDPERGEEWCEVAVLKLADPSNLRDSEFVWATDEVFEEFDPDFGGDTVMIESARLPELLKHLNERKSV